MMLKEYPKGFMVFAISVFMLAGMCSQSCSGTPFSVTSEPSPSSWSNNKEQPSPSMSVTGTPGVIQSPVPVASPGETTSPRPSPTAQDLKVKLPRIVLYKNVVAGDYGILKIQAEGQVEFTSYNRLNQITAHKLGSVDPQDVDQLYTFIDEKGFFELESEYDIYPLDPDDSMVYEDIYYWLKISVGDQIEKIVVAHEKARPPELIEITDVLIDRTSHLPDVPLSGGYIVAGDPEILLHKRNLQDLPVLELEEINLDEYPRLVEGLNNPYTLIQIDDLHGAGLEKLLDDEIMAMEVVYQDKRYAVLLLKGQE